MVKKMVTGLVESGTKVPRWVLTNFKDPDAELVTSATEVEELRDRLDELKYGGGGDIDEQALKGMGELDSIAVSLFTYRETSKLV